LVEFEPDYTLIDHAGLLVDLRELLGRPVDVVNEPFVREEYQTFIIADAISINIW
jgi:predicted nucleotidyltransferase